MERHRLAGWYGNLARSIQLFDQVAVFFGLLLCGLNNGFCPFDGRSPNTEVSGDVISRVSWGGPLRFRHCGGMTEVRTVSLAIASLPAL
jgi:hypothetical protein